MAFHIGWVVYRRGVKHCFSLIIYEFLLIFSHLKMEKKICHMILFLCLSGIPLERYCQKNAAYSSGAFNKRKILLSSFPLCTLYPIHILKFCIHCAQFIISPGRSLFVKSSNVSNGMSDLGLLQHPRWSAL